MVTAAYTIAFNFKLENSNLSVPLTAEVEQHHSETYYIVRKFKVASHSRDFVLPNISIKKKNGQWVHVDSEKETRLSTMVGQMIERHEGDCDHGSRGV
jgi:hypothetical protein